MGNTMGLSLEWQSLGLSGNQLGLDKLWQIVDRPQLLNTVVKYHNKFLIFEFKWLWVILGCKSISL